MTCGMAGDVTIWFREQHWRAFFFAAGFGFSATIQCWMGNGVIGRDIYYKPAPLHLFSVCYTRFSRKDGSRLARGGGWGRERGGGGGYGGNTTYPIPTYLVTVSRNATWHSLTHSLAVSVERDRYLYSRLDHKWIPHLSLFSAFCKSWPSCTQIIWKWKPQSLTYFLLPIIYSIRFTPYITSSPAQSIIQTYCKHYIKQYRKHQSKPK